MKTLIHRFLSLLKSLFLTLSVILTLEIGKGKVNKEDELETSKQELDVHEDTSERGKSDAKD